jgi:2-dehydro-3-deoxyphosphogluconate aldolase/(4S)-4-hydroxy-2-oxoglutarate aldolase
MGGMTYLKSMAGPYSHLGLRFMPLGGVNAENMVPYLKSPLVFAVGGSFVARRSRIQERDWAGITETARQAVETAAAVRTSN